MAHGRGTKKDEEELFDKPEDLKKKVSELADLIKNSKHMIAFTGAGISTSAGIPDFRSGKNTVLSTGAGCWTRRDADKEGASYKKGKSIKNKLTALPTPAHMSLVKLHKAGHLKHLISQNCDGLHRRSGFAPKALSELHGNTNLEKCQKCGTEYLRDFRCRVARGASHLTGRKCTNGKCRGPLWDSIINFGQNLPEKELNDGFKNAEKADLCLALGSSLTVTPAADMPEAVGKKKSGNLVIVNLQRTPLDRVAKFRINAKIDDVMVPLMKELKLDIPVWRLKRFLRIRLEKGTKKVGNKTEKTFTLHVHAVDSDEIPYTLFKFIKMSLPLKDKVETIIASQRKTKLVMSERQFAAFEEGSLTLCFFGHYAEPDLTFKISEIMPPEGKSTRIQLQYDHTDGSWAYLIDGQANPPKVKDEVKDEDDQKEDIKKPAKPSGSCLPNFGPQI